MGEETGRVAGKVALVTGAAQGLGAATARLLAREGAAVLLTDLQPAGAGVAAEIVVAGGSAAFLVHDATDEAAWASVIEQVKARFGGLHILVNNAGVGTPNRNPENASLAEFERMMDMNMKSVFLGTRAAIPLIRECGGGSIVNLSSIHGLAAAPHNAPYGAAKGAVRLYTKATAVYCAQQGYGIRCNSVHPGFIDTPMLVNAMRGRGDEAEQRRLAEARIPLGEIGRADDIAFAILYLASDESRYVTGIELPVDGGYSAV
jgi:NAD(P)-dependent dehydrogenase (short-subunit alcohol dehydrogenase family)